MDSCNDESFLWWFLVLWSCWIFLLDLNWWFTPLLLQGCSLCTWPKCHIWILTTLEAHSWGVNTSNSMRKFHAHNLIAHIDFSQCKCPYYTWRLFESLICLQTWLSNPCALLYATALICPLSFSSKWLRCVKYLPLSGLIFYPLLMSCLDLCFHMSLIIWWTYMWWNIAPCAHSVNRKYVHVLGKYIVKIYWKLFLKVKALGYNIFKHDTHSTGNRWKSVHFFNKWVLMRVDCCITFFFPIIYIVWFDCTLLNVSSCISLRILSFVGSLNCSCIIYVKWSTLNTCNQIIISIRTRYLKGKI